MKEKKQTETETKIKNADKQIEAKVGQIPESVGKGIGQLHFWLPNCLEPVK